MKILARDDIQARLTELRKPLENAARTQALSEREKKRAVLWSIIETGEDNAKCRALDILNKMDAEYLNITVNKDEKSIDLAHIDTEALKSIAQ